MVIRVGIVGTGYAAEARVKALKADARSRPIAVSGCDFSRAARFASSQELSAVDGWRSLVASDSVDLVIVATISALHGEVAEAAIRAGKHVIVEYPLSLSVDHARRLIALAAENGLLLHVEHIELIGGLHQAMQTSVTEIGEVNYVNYRTLNPQNPAPRKWTYCKALFGFPYIGALSRVQRMVNLFGTVGQVSCCTRYVGAKDDGWFRGVLSSARLEFVSGVVAELTYGKGEGLWAKRRVVEVQGSLGAITFSGNQGQLVTAEGEKAIAVAPRKGLLAKDTEAVLDYLTEGKPLYISVSESLYALEVADALRQASERSETVVMSQSLDAADATA